MLNMANNPKQLMEHEKAEEVAAELNATDDDDWTYKVKHDPTGKGWSFIEVYEDDELIGQW